MNAPTHYADKAAALERGGLWSSAAVLYRMACNASKDARHKSQYRVAARKCEQHVRATK